MTHATGAIANVVYLAWGCMGEDFTVHATRIGALAFLQDGDHVDAELADDINGHIGGVSGNLDGYYVEACEVRP